MTPPNAEVLVAATQATAAKSAATAAVPAQRTTTLTAAGATTSTALAAATITTTTATATSTTKQTATDAPESLTAFWGRIHQLMFVPAIDNLTPLPASQRDDALFGVADALSTGDASAPVLRGMGASVDRVELRWDVLEPAPGVYDFADFDQTLKLNEQLGFTVLAVVDGSPQWAVPAGSPHGNSPPAGLDQPVYLADGTVNPANLWASFLATVVARYGTRIADWEIWNEPDTQDFWNGSPQQYARLLDVAHTVLTRREPGTHVLSGGMAFGDSVFLSQVVDALCPHGPCSDGFPRDIAWHVYDNPLDIPKLVSLTRVILQMHNVTPAVWITESNVPVIDPQAPGDAVVGPDSVTLAQQAAFVLQAYVLARQAGVHTLMVYRAADVDDRGHYWGLLRRDFTARPALLAYRTAAQWLSGTRPLGFTQSVAGVTYAAFCGSAGRVDVLWNSAPAATVVMLPYVATGAERISIAGDVQPLDITAGLAHVVLPATAPGTTNTVPLGSPVIIASPGGCTSNPTPSPSPAS